MFRRVGEKNRLKYNVLFFLIEREFKKLISSKNKIKMFKLRLTRNTLMERKKKKLYFLDKILTIYYFKQTLRHINGKPQKN